MTPVLMTSDKDGASSLTGKSFPTFSSKTVQALVGVLEELAEPTGEADLKDIGRQLRSLADEFSQQGVLAAFMGIFAGGQAPLDDNQRANDIASRLITVANRLELRTESNKSA